MSSQQSDKDETFAEDVVKPNSIFGARHTQAVMLFSLITLGYGMRVNLSVGIVAMTDPNASPNTEVPTYDWDDTSIVLSSFFWGYVITQIGAGQLAKQYGPKWFLVVTMAINSVFTIIIPFVAGFGSWAVIVCRVIQGLAQGFIFPSCHNLLSKWVPPLERARIGTFVYAGGSFGTVLSMPFTGWLSGTTLGWPYAFYIYGIVGLLWCLLWAFLGKNSPGDHKGINPMEKKYIEVCLGQSQNYNAPPTPWKAIFTSVPMIALIVAHSGQNWGFSTLLTNIPTYMEKILNFDIKSNGVLSAGPYLVFSVLTIASGSVVDYVITNKYVSTAVARKISNSIGTLVPAAALLTLGLIGDSDSDITTPTLVLLFVAVGVNGVVHCGYQVNHMDLSPVHSGTLMGITNAISNVFSIIAPLILQFIVTEQENPLQWAIVFYISAGVYVVANTIFVLCGSAEIQSWNYANSVKDSQKVSDTSTVPIERY